VTGPENGLPPRHGSRHRGESGFYRWQHRRAHREPPKWWPHDEPWPPAGEFPWQRMRRRFFVRFAIGVFLIFAFVVAGPLIVIAQLLAAFGLPSPGSGILAAVVLVGLIAILAGTARSARRIALPFGDLIEAAGRVEAGDYSARVSESHLGPRELRSLMQAFNAMAARLETDEQQRRSLLADVSHELRTPLAVLRGDLEAMLDGIHPTDQAHLSAAVEEIELLTQLVEDLRTLALAEAGTLALHLEQTDFSVLAHDSVAAFHSMAEAAGVRIETEMAGDLPLIDLDPLRIRQVLDNLIANALHYAPTGTVVRVTGALEDGAIVIAVADEGPGIAPDVLPHLFERFAKSGDSRGSGLGLAIARRLVEAHGGTIGVETASGAADPAGHALGAEPSTVPAGTIIRFGLPLEGRT
jgi:signal transduction histidine kinase